MDNEALYKEAEEAIKRLYNDRSVDWIQTVANLEELMGDIEVMIDALEDSHGSE
jgi:hypothetical protein